MRTRTVLAESAPRDARAPVLVLTTVWPGGRRSGSELVTQAFVDALRAAGRRAVVLAYLRPGAGGPEHPDDRIAGVRPIETEQAPAATKAAWMASAVLRRLPYSAAKYRSRGYRRHARALLDELRPAVVVVDHAQAAWLLGDLAGAPGRVYLAHNVEHELYAEQAAERGGLVGLVYRREARRVRRLEQRLTVWADRVWALSAADAAALGPAARAFGPPSLVGPAEGEPEVDVVLLGRWTWAANALGLEWFLDEVLPQLPEGTSVRVGGAGADRLRARHPRAAFVGEVPDAAAFLATGRVIAIPSRAGSGVQVKTLDAIATGRPVVATTVALRGLGDPPAGVRSADDPARFAALLGEAREGAGPAWGQERRRAFDAAVAAAIAEVAGG